MSTSVRWSCLAILAGIVAVAGARPSQAQETAAVPYQQVISANPFGIILEFFNAEYERAVSESATAGFGGSTASLDKHRYVNADLFLRYYPITGAFEGWAFGGKAGLTKAGKWGTYFGLGFDVNRSWLLGKEKNFYVGVGFGLKRLLGETDDGVVMVIPTFRIVNVGFAF